MVRLLNVSLILFTMTACSQSLTAFQPTDPAPDLLKNPEPPALTGDKGLDAVTFAGEFVSERCRVIGWQQWYHDLLEGIASFNEEEFDGGPRPIGC